ncbi:MAG: hypothetical protein R3F13_07540 [Prosthecobacter sp.]
MKTFTHKLKLSILAMLCGWLACNIAWWVGILLEVHYDDLRLEDSLEKALFIGAATGIVILAAWIVIFLPVDLLVPDQSSLRRPMIAAICGFVAGSSVIAIPWAWSIWENDSTHHLLADFQWKESPFILSPGITGMVAAYVRSRFPHHTRVVP